VNCSQSTDSSCRRGEKIRGSRENTARTRSYSRFLALSNSGALLFSSVVRNMNAVSPKMLKRKTRRI